ncbi:ABC-type amino acid transport system permease subunit [Bartonella fuyuanensis]|uniref:ABC-type amino acid transport system permease subunit n=1 Tax=Bartonella fuyuanensis TaxID=1460968 RepID=A0A840DVI9_9HYPH|nr:ABC-type amino acid transport system permease subunit [Bartonella fuyuanensis]
MAMEFTIYQSYRYILLSHTVRAITPPLTSEAMGIVKKSSIAFVDSINKLTQFQYQAIEEIKSYLRKLFVCYDSLYSYSFIGIYCDNNH